MATVEERTRPSREMCTDRDGNEYHAGTDQYWVLSCEEHGTSTVVEKDDLWMADSHAEWCEGCYRELVKGPVPEAGGCEWSRTDQSMSEDERAEREMFARLER